MKNLLFRILHYFDKDIVKVTRCKDCIKCGTYRCSMDWDINDPTDYNDYCSCGVRRKREK